MQRLEHFFELAWRTRPHGDTSPKKRERQQNTTASTSYRLYRFFLKLPSPGCAGDYVRPGHGSCSVQAVQLQRRQKVEVAVLQNLLRRVLQKKVMFLRSCSEYDHRSLYVWVGGSQKCHLPQRMVSFSPHAFLAIGLRRGFSIKISERMATAPKGNRPAATRSNKIGDFSLCTSLISVILNPYTFMFVLIADVQSPSSMFRLTGHENSAVWEHKFGLLCPTNASSLRQKHLNYLKPKEHHKSAQHANGPQMSHL